MNKIDELKGAIQRFDHYYDSVNNKGNVYLSIGTFLLGGVIAGYAALRENSVCGDTWFEITLLSIIILSNACALIYTLLAINPFTGKVSGNSFFFYGDVAGRSLPQWRTYVANLQEMEHLEDLVVQSHVLSTGLQAKFERLKTATVCLGVELFFLTIAALYLLISKSTN